MFPLQQRTEKVERSTNTFRVRAWFIREGQGEGQDETQMSAPLSEPNARQFSVTRHAGRVTLRLRVRSGTGRFYRWLERLFARYRRARVSFFHFLCRVFIETWKSSLLFDGAYAAVYARDRYRCTCPVCGRNDVDNPRRSHRRQ